MFWSRRDRKRKVYAAGNVRLEFDSAEGQSGGDAQSGAATFDVQDIVSNALKLAQNSVGGGNTGGFTKIVNGKVVQATDEDKEEFAEMFEDLAMCFSGLDEQLGQSSYSGTAGPQGGRETVVECPVCGARNAVEIGRVGSCEYCGTKISV